MATTSNNKKTTDQKIDLFKADLKAEKQLKAFDTIFNASNGDWAATKTALTEEKDFTPELIDKLEFTHTLSVWGGDNKELVSLFQKDKATNSMRDIALSLNKTAFIEKVKATAPESTEEQKTAFADNLHRELFQLEPTAMLVNMVKDPEVPLLNNTIGASVAAILEKQPEFNIKTTSVYEALKKEDVLKDIPAEAQEAVKTQLKTLQRITAVSPLPDAIPVLYNAQFHTALQIADVPPAQFKTMMADKGLDEHTLAQVHDNAQALKLRNEQALIAIKEAGRPTGIAFIDKSLVMTGVETIPDNATDRAPDPHGQIVAAVMEKNNLSWDMLFGDADFCECGECTSVYSAASYYVELLQYLRNNNLDPTNPNTGKTTIANTPLEKLFNRRPDLGCLELTCKNTNTILPYIDLVNEVMENYVAFKHLKPFNVDDETSSELLSEPQHTEYQAYCILKNSVYPFSLPYHQPIDATRIYLKFLDTSRHEVLDTFRKNNTVTDSELTRLKDELLDRAVDAEFLHITKEEYVILTKECFESKALMDKLKNKVHTDAEYRQIIGVKPVCQYYGFANDTVMLANTGLTRIKKEFLPRTGIDYVSLVALLKTAYINSCMPKGKSKVIMESLHSSYSFLQRYAQVYGMDKMADLLASSEAALKMLPHLEGTTALYTLPGIPGTNSPCPPVIAEEDQVTKTDIQHWVKCHFQQVGKMIVIDSSRGCIDGWIWPGDGGYNGEFLVFSAENCTLFQIFLFSTQKIEAGSVDKKTGKITLNERYQQYTSHINNWIFAGSKGEKGVVHLVKDSAYLFVTEQKDSCDLGTAVLQHLDGSPLTVEEYDRIHRFIRLQQKLGWTIHETDKAIIGLSMERTTINAPGNPVDESICSESAGNECCDEHCDDCEGDCTHVPYDINPFLLHQLVPVKKLLDKTGLELVKLLVFWTDISTAGEKSLYQRLFLTHNVLGIDKVFKASANGNYLPGDAKTSDHIPVIMAALNLSADDIAAIINDATLTDSLTISNLSVLYRYRLLSKALGLKIPAFINILPLFGNIFQDAGHSWTFMDRWARMEDAGFTHQQLNFIIRGVDDEKKPFTPTQRSVLLFSKSLYDGLNTIDTAHPDLKADDAITDAGLRALNILEKATTDLAGTKASLLFDGTTTDKITGLLEGKIIFSTNAPGNITVNLPDDKTLKTKLRYEKTPGRIFITGILTEAEVIDYKTISGDVSWTAAFTRIQKQQNKLFKELLSGVFESETTKTTAEKAALEAMIKTGDIIVPADQLTEGQADPNTAPQKRAAFLNIFLPYLRQQLTHRFVVDSLSAFVSLEATITDVLVSKILRVGHSTGLTLPMYNIFEKIKESSKPADSNWSGYLSPSGNAAYTFIIKDSDTAPVLTIDGVPLIFAAQEDPTNEWWSQPVALQSGKLYKLLTAGVPLISINWKTTASAIAPVPSSVLIPDFASQQCAPALTALKKAALLVSTFKLSADEIQFLTLHAVNFGHLNFNGVSLTHWLRLEAYTRLRNSLPETTLNILDFFNRMYDPASDPAKISMQVSELTTWKKERVDKLIAAGHFNMRELKDFYNEKNLLKLQNAIAVADKISVDIDLLFDWAVPSSKFKTCRKIADSIKHAIRAKYNQADWEQVVKPLHDELRNNQKNALIAFLLQQRELLDWGVTDADGLFEYFLIDVQMDACMETSRIKQGISSVQLFIQRCFLGLEEKYSHIGPNVLDRRRWDWMQRYRVWEANRKVFLYPENWIEGNLRDDKSPFFKELESELLQKDISKENVTDALKSYLYKVDEVASMEVIGLYIDGTKTGQLWSKDAKLHVFSRTLNAPYFFYYRYLALDEMNWYAWEKMQVDIPGYDVQDPVTNVVADNGCYLAPMVWNGRLLVFFPQIMKKIRTNPIGGSFNSLANDNNGIQNTKPVEYYEVKLAWSEYRNNKWTQKQVSKTNIVSDISSSINALEHFKFVPRATSSGVTIYFDNYLDSDAGFKGAFEFDGSIVKVAASALPLSEGIPISYFNRNGNKEMYSWQINSTGARANKDFFSKEVNSNELFVGIPNTSAFYHTDIKNFIGFVSSGNLEDFFKYNLSMGSAAFGPYDPDNSSSTPNIYHELKQPYSLYNWELFFHTPLMLADALSKAQHFEEAMKWYHFIFNPIADGTDDKRFWQFKPFKEVNSQRILDSIFNSLTPNWADQSINEWRNNAFMPHVVARSRPVAYMKKTVTGYIDNLLAWGDYLFRQDTIETINQATQLYILALHILGPKPMMIPKRGTIKPQTYLTLLNKWDAFGNAITELELVAPFSSQSSMSTTTVTLEGEVVSPNIFGFSSALYFCIPNNPKLMGYWDTLADRLFNIRHCQNIEGVFRKLPLFEPPIDPALLVKAAAQGLSIASVLNDLNTPMPNYRFYYLLQKALELCGELKSMGNALLSAIEKGDNETVALIRAKHENIMNNLAMEIKKKQLEEAEKTLISLQQNRKAPESRMKYYLKLSGLDENAVPNESAEFNGLPNEIVTVDGDSGLKLIPYEKEDMDKASEAQNKQLAAALPEKLASIMHILPSFGAHFTPFGLGGSISFGGSNLGSAFQAWAKFLQLDASELSYASSSAGKKGGFTRAIQDRVFQANAAGFELKQIDKQVTAQQIRIQIANQEIANQQQMIDNALEVEEFLKNKYTNEELYSWMRGSLKTLYYQVYSLTYELAKKAEKVYRFERGLSNSNFIQPGYWNAGRDGLLAGEQLYVGLKQLEAAYQDQRGYDYEVVKHVSLQQIDPLALIQLRETGKCEFECSEAWFDMDYPGHYKRRIKTVSVSIPCIAGPYTGVNATLRLLENKFRNTAIGGKAYEENTEETDERFSTYNIPITAIAASSAQNDSGTFELNFKDERYLPFEGAGVISKWRLELPVLHQFDYSTISDVIVHIKYTASEGGERLKLAAAGSLSKRLKEVQQQLAETGLHVMINMKHDLPNEWHLLTQTGTVNMKIDQPRLPFMAQHAGTKIEEVIFLVNAPANSITVTVDGEATAIPLEKINAAWKLNKGKIEDEPVMLDKPFELSIAKNLLEDIIIVVKYNFK